jgi:hypothetical protein
MLVVSRNFYKDVRIIWNLLVLFITINSQTYLFSSPSTLNRTDAAPYKKRPSEKFHESTSNEKISLASNICPFQAQQSALRAPSIPIEVPYTPSSSFFLRLCLHIDPQRYMVRESSRINLKRENFTLFVTRTTWWWKVSTRMNSVNSSSLVLIQPSILPEGILRMIWTSVLDSF